MDLVLDLLTRSTLLALFSILLFFYLFLYRSYKISHSKEAPLVSGSWPIIGHLPLISSSKTPHTTLGALADKYGPLFTIKLGSKRALVLSNWEMAKECFTKFDSAISTRPKLDATQHLAYNGAMFVFAPYGSYWRQVRKVATSEIRNHHRVEKQQHFYMKEARAWINELFNVWRNKNDESSNFVLVEMKQWFTHLSFNIFLPMIVGKRYFGATNVIDKEEAQRFLKALQEMMHLLGVFTLGDAIPFLKWFDFGGNVKAMKETSKELDKILDELLEERRHKRRLSEKVDHDFMDTLLDEKTIEEFHSDNTIKGALLTLVLGGTDTTIVTLTWALCLLLRNPLALKKAKEELDIEVGKERCVRDSDIDNLVYLQAITKETLRLYPPGPLAVPREFSENCNLGGYEIRKGTRLILNLWKIHTDPNVWSDPLEFKPERFLTTHKDVDVRGHHFELLPFGGGRRICPGISMALQMVHISLASFLHSFDILNPSNEPIIDMTETFGLTNTKTTPLEILIKPRLSSNCYEIM